MALNLANVSFCAVAVDGIGNNLCRVLDYVTTDTKAQVGNWSYWQNSFDKVGFGELIQAECGDGKILLQTYQGNSPSGGPGISVLCGDVNTFFYPAE